MVLGVCGMTATEVLPLSAHEKATRLLALRVLKDWIAAEDRRLREELAAEVRVGERYAGALPGAAAADVLGFVQMVKGREAASVVDQAALLAWVEEWAPGEVVTTRAVRPAFVTALLAAVKGDGGWVDPLTSEVVDVDGIEIKTSAPTLNVKPTAEADQLVRDAIRDRRLELGPAT
jgi:hypothetical protein